MSPKKGKKGTPPELDFAFERHLISEDDYKTFWPRWNDANAKEREEIITELLEGSDPEESMSGPVVRDQYEAEQHAAILGGYVVRRNAHGKFSKRGTYFQAIRRK